MEETQIQIMKTTRDKLIELGKKGDTYDDIINRIIEQIENKEGSK